MYTNVRNQYQLIALNPATADERVILERRRQTIFPRVSPNAPTVTFFGFADAGDTQIFVTPIDGGAAQQVTQGKGHHTMPRWSPDGSLIYYYEQRPGTALKSVSVNGGASREFRPWQWESHTQAEFSPDGSRVAYYRQASEGEKDVVERTVVEDLNSGVERTLALPILPRCWSRDGRTLLGHTTKGPAVVAVCPVAGASCHQLAPGQLPVWSLDGSRIYFLRNTTTPAIKELWSMRSDGSDERKLFDRMGPYAAIDVTFDLSQSGEIVFSRRIDGRHELWQAILQP